jgi:hypothetical protein
VGHVGVYDLNVVFAHEACEFSSALYIKRVSQRQRNYVSLHHALQLRHQRRLWAQCDMHVMASRNQTIGEISQVTLAATESLSRAYLKDSQYGVRLDNPKR